MSQKFRVRELKIKSGTTNRSGLVTENMTSSTPDKLVGTTFKAVLVNELGEQVVGPESSGGTSTLNVAQTGHGFALLDWLRFNEATSTWVKAQADDAEHLGHWHVIEVTDANNFVVTKEGVYNIPNSLAKGEYILSSATAGAYTQTTPTVLGELVLYGMEVIDANTVSIYTVSAFTTTGTTTPPVMGGAGTTTATNIGTTTVDLTGTYTSDGGSPVTATGFVLYPSGNPSTVIGGANVIQFPDATLPSPINATATGLTSNTNYCFKPYATNSVGTSYGTELCFTTLAGNQFGYVAETNNNGFAKINLSTGVKVASYTPAGIVAPRAIYQTKDGQYIAISGFSSNNIAIFASSNLTTPLYTLPAGTDANGITEDGLGNIYVASWNGQQVRKINLSTGTNTGTFNSTARLHYITYANGKLYAGAYISDGTIKVINPNTMSLITSISLGGDIYELGSSADGQHIYAAAFTSGTVYKISTATDTSVGGVGVPSVLGIGVNGNSRVVASTNTGSIVIIDTSTMSIIASVSPGGNYFSAAYGGLMNRYYVSDRTGTTIKVVDASTNTLLPDITGIISPREFTS